MDRNKTEIELFGYKLIMQERDAGDVLALNELLNNTIVKEETYKLNQKFECHIMASAISASLKCNIKTDLIKPEMYKWYDRLFRTKKYVNYNKTIEEIRLNEILSEKISTINIIENLSLRELNTLTAKLAELEGITISKDDNTGEQTSKKKV